MTTIPHPSGADHWSHRKPERVLRGPKAPGAKLTTADIARLYADLEEIDANKTHLAIKYGVSRYTIWRHDRARKCNAR